MSNGKPGAQALLEFLAHRGKEISPLLILTHNHPDPDAMGTALTLAFLAEKLHGIRSRIAYGGIIGRIENQTMARTLRIPINPLREGDLQRYQNVALVDTQPPFQNNPFKRRRKATVIIDHHPQHPSTLADFIWIDETAGATATLMAETLFSSGLEVPSRLATALAYGIASAGCIALLGHYLRHVLGGWGPCACRAGGIPSNCCAAASPSGRPAPSTGWKARSCACPSPFPPTASGASSCRPCACPTCGAPRAPSASSPSPAIRPATSPMIGRPTAPSAG